MQPDEVLTVLATLEEGNLRAWIDGGWGVDALLGEITRPHEDLDLVVELGALGAVFECLSGLGFSVIEDLSPVRVVLRSLEGRQVDLHPVTFDEDGTGWQIRAAPDGSDCPYPAGGFTVGTIMDVAVPCLSAELQLQHHSGYLPRDRDREDMARLQFGLASNCLRHPDGWLIPGGMGYPTCSRPRRTTRAIGTLGPLDPTEDLA